MAKKNEVEIDHGKCLDKVRKQIIKATPEVKAVRFDLANVSSSKNKYKYTGQRITVVEQYKKRDGSIGEKEIKSFVGHDFCPFCGKKIH